MNTRTKQRATRYRRKATRAFGTFCQPYWLWLWRAKLAAKGFGPAQLRGKSAGQLFALLYGD